MGRAHEVRRAHRRWQRLSRRFGVVRIGVSVWAMRRQDNRDEVVDCANTRLVSTIFLWTTNYLEALLLYGAILA